MPARLAGALLGVCVPLLAPAAAEPLANPETGASIFGPVVPGETGVAGEPSIGGARAQAPAASEARRLGPAPAARSGTPTVERAPRAESGGNWLVRTGGALALVLALIFGVRAAVRRVAGRAGLMGQIGAGGRAPAGILEALGRYPVSRGQTLVLLRLDRRVLLLSQSSSGFSLLTEVNDPDEVASLLVQARDADGDSMAQRFRGLLRAMERDPSIVGEDDREPDYRAGRGTLEPEPLATGGADPVVSLRRRLTAMRGVSA